MFHPSKPKAVGLEFQPKPFFYLIGRKSSYIPLFEFEFSKNATKLRSANPTSGKAAEDHMGFSWDETVIWVGMKVHTSSGKFAGVIRDVSVSKESGEVLSLGLTEGVTSDTAIGRRKIDGENVVGFDGENVVIEDVLAQADFSGGAAAAAGRRTAVAKVRTEQVARKAAVIGKVGAKVAADSEIAKKTKGALGGFAKEFKKAMSKDDK